jgi:hypothetical protein
MVGVEPFHQGPACVQRELQARIAFKQIEKWLVAVAIRLLEDVIEIANGLMIMQDKDEPDGLHFWLARLMTFVANLR